MRKIVVTGAGGLLGWHAAARLHARNRAALFVGGEARFEIVALDRAGFGDDATLRSALEGCAAVLHYAGVNRGDDDHIEQGNPAIARRLAHAIREMASPPVIVHANSIHADHDKPYGRSKRGASTLLADATPRFVDLRFPHIFGECARPYYNNVTATLIDQIINDMPRTVRPGARVELLHAGQAADMAIAAALDEYADPRPSDAARPMAVTDLRDRIEGFHALYGRNDVFPDLSDPFDLALFNTYRAALYPSRFPRDLEMKADDRGVLFEAARGGRGGQTFLSWTKPGVTRGDHFHLSKVERFVVLDGEAMIRIRRVLGADVWEYPVRGDRPRVVDMPTLHTHSIENVGDKPLLTLFWSDTIFDPAQPDTYADRVLDE